MATKDEEKDAPQPKTPLRLRREISRRFEWCYVCAGHWLLLSFFFSAPLLLAWATLAVPSVRPLAALYLAWMYYDRETPHNGGRRFEFARNLKFWNCRRDYFPIALVKSVALPADRTYLFGAFPHGLFVLGASTNFCSETNEFSRLFPQLVPHVATLNSNYWWPITRDIGLAFGNCAASSRSISHILNGPAGNVCVLLIGGMKEITRSWPGPRYVVVLLRRKGFVREALRAGSSLVPVYSFGETNVFEPIRSEWYARLQRWLENRTGAPFGVFRGRTIFAGLPIGGIFSVLPFQRPITTVVGRPIDLPKVENPSPELIDRYHDQFVRELRHLFDSYKEQYDEYGANATLEIA